MSRFDYRSKDTFKKDIMFGTKLEKFFFEEVGVGFGGRVGVFCLCVCLSGLCLLVGRCSPATWKQPWLQKNAYSNASQMASLDLGFFDCKGICLRSVFVIKL